MPLSIASNAALVGANTTVGASGTLNVNAGIPAGFPNPSSPAFPNANIASGNTVAGTATVTADTLKGTSKNNQYSETLPV